MDNNYTSKQLNNNPEAYLKAAKKNSTKKALIIVAAIIIALGLIGFFIVTGISRVLKGTDTYNLAINTIQNDPEVKKLTGGIKDYGFLSTGSIEIDNGVGTASLTITVKGVKKDIDVAVAMEKAANSEWKVTDMEIVE